MSLRLAAVGAAAVVAADQAVKTLVRADVPQGSSRELIPGVELVHTKNTGVSFGFLNDAPVWVVGLFSAIAMVAVVGITVWALRGKARDATVALILGGAIGNLIDRLAFGSVTDFLDLPALPPCNVADIAITFGAIVMFAGLLFTDAGESRQTSDAGESRQTTDAGA